MRPWTRARLFIRDYLEELPIPWSLAKMRDCERVGGHQWGLVEMDDVFLAFGRTCARCGTWESDGPYEADAVPSERGPS